MRENFLSIIYKKSIKVVNIFEANNVELASNMLFIKSGNKIWRNIGDYAYNLHNSSGIVYVTEEVFDEFPLKNWKEYR